MEIKGFLPVDLQMTRVFGAEALFKKSNSAYGPESRFTFPAGI
jgi:hypothetical protein